MKNLLVVTLFAIVVVACKSNSSDSEVRLAAGDQVIARYEVVKEEPVYDQQTGRTLTFKTDWGRRWYFKETELKGIDGSQADLGSWKTNIKYVFAPPKADTKPTLKVGDAVIFKLSGLIPNWKAEFPGWVGV